TTRSLDAYRSYLRGVAHLNRAEYRQARDALLDAVRIDSAFAQAYGKLAEVSLLAFSVLDPDNPAYGYAERAAALRNRLPPRPGSRRARWRATAASCRVRCGARSVPGAAATLSSAWVGSRPAAGVTRHWHSSSPAPTSCSYRSCATRWSSSRSIPCRRFRRSRWPPRAPARGPQPRHGPGAGWSPAQPRPKRAA